MRVLTSRERTHDNIIRRKTVRRVASVCYQLCPLNDVSVVLIRVVCGDEHAIELFDPG